MQNEKNRSKRLRKKLFVGEFAVQGFAFSCTIDASDETALDAFFNGLLDLVESRNLQIGGGGNQENFEGYISSGDRYGSATEDDKKALEEWLAAQTNISNTVVEGLSDAYYSE